MDEKLPQRSDTHLDSDLSLHSSLLEILALPPTEREASARRFSARYPERREALEELLAHAREIEEAEQRGIQTPPQERLRKLRERAGPTHRYEFRREVNRGGMGVIQHVWDDDLGRSVAMKVMIGSAEEESVSEHHAPTKVERFLAEAQITSQLDHPGVIPVYDVGIEEGGRIYFTMPFVKGRTVAEVFRHAREQKNGWDLTRALEVLLKVCDTLAFAHERDVVHRDVKPANVMVGRFGEVYLMDWGLAKVRGQAERERPRPKIGEDLPRTVIHTDRSQKRQGSSSTTQDGTVLGTPSFMSPEQGFGRIEEVGPATDIYAVGAMLYVLLTGREPYHDTASSPTPHAVLDCLLEGPPTPVPKLDPKAPPELVSICEKAMARKVAQRYASMSELSRDLRDFLAGRVVRAHVTGPIAELRKWVGRNRALAAAAVLGLAALVAGLATSLYFYAREREAVRETDSTLRELLLLSKGEELRELELRASDLRPLGKTIIPSIELWLRDAEKLAAELPELRKQRPPLTHRGSRSAILAPIEHRWRTTQFERLVTMLDTFSNDRGPKPETLQIGLHTVPAVRLRLEAARKIERTLEQDTREWEEVIGAIAADERFTPVRLQPQEGLVPLGPDPSSGLQEFWHVLSGDRPQADPGYPQTSSSRWRIQESTGIVLVLIPGGEMDLGATNDQANLARHDEYAEKQETPLLKGIDLDPFFISKYEITQGQWHRLCGRNPSLFAAEKLELIRPVDLTQPLESVSWTEAREALSWVGLALPTEAQWEYACRAGTDGPWGDPDAAEEILRGLNLCDEKFLDSGMSVVDAPPEPWNDGHAIPAPVGTFPANPFGLHEMLGNLFEWCADSFVLYENAKPAPGTGLLADDPDRRRVFRGGAYNYSRRYARASWRSAQAARHVGGDIGLRPARALSR